MSANITPVFDKLRTGFEKQDAVREALRARREAADDKVRPALRLVASFHTTTDLRAAATSVRAALRETGPQIAQIEAALPHADSFYRYIDIWHNQLQSCAMVAVLVAFFESGDLLDADAVPDMLGAPVRIPLEDFLTGVCNALTEMVRIATNRVILADYATAVSCSRFAASVFEAFKEMNFRNDFLRKRYDGVKYDIKRLEEIVYDLSIRGLLGKSDQKMKDEPEVKQEAESKAVAAE